MTAFCNYRIIKILAHNIGIARYFKTVTKEELEADLTFANTVAVLCVTKRGAIPALPSLEEVEAFK